MLGLNAIRRILRQEPVVRSMSTTAPNIFGAAFTRRETSGFELRIDPANGIISIVLLDRRGHPYRDRWDLQVDEASALAAPPTNQEAIA